MANVAGERKKGRNRNTVENCRGGDNGRGIAAIFLMGGAVVAGILLAAIIAPKRKKEKTKDMGMREKKETRDSCKGAMNRQEDDLGLLSLLPLDVKASIEPIEKECRPGFSTNTDEKASPIFQEKQLSQQFIERLNKGDAAIPDFKIEKEGALFLRHLEAFPPDASSLDQQNLQAEKIVDSNIEKEGDVFLPNLKASPPCSTYSLDQQNLQAEKIVDSSLSQLLHDEGYSSLASNLSSQNGGRDSSDAGHGSHCFVSLPSLTDDITIGGGDGSPLCDCNDIAGNGGCGSRGKESFVSPPTLDQNYGNDSGGHSSDSSISLLSLEDDSNDSGGSDDYHNSVFLPLLQNDHGGDNVGGDGGGSGSVSLLLLQDDGCASNHSGGSGVDDCDGDSSLPLLLLQDGGGGEISTSDDYDVDHEKENSSVAFELENSAGAITITVAAEVISCGSYSSGPEGFSAGTSPITTWPKLSISERSKQNLETNRLPFGISNDVGDDDDEDDDQSKYTHFEQQQRRGIEVRKIFEEDMRCNQELAEESRWAHEALSILQSVDTNLLILSAGAVLLLFVVQFVIHVNMS